jgi:O-antigen/teichoic acid export membrane protein
MGPDLLRHLALSLFGASTARGLMFVTLPFAARLYSKDDFGGLALVVGFVGLIQPILTLRYEIALILPRSDAVARGLAYGLLFIAGAGYLVVAVLVALAPDLLSPFADPKVIAVLRPLVLLHLASGVLTVTLTAWLQRKTRFKIVALSQFLGALTTAICVIGAPLVLAPDLVVLFSGYVAGAVVSALVVASGAILNGFLSRAGTGSLRRIRRLLLKYRVYPTYSLPLSLSLLISDRTLLLYISSAFSLAALGGFYSIRQLLFGLVHLVTASISQVIFAYAARTSGGISGLRKPLLTLAGGISAAAGAALGWVFVNATEVTLVLLGEDWLDVATMVPWIAGQASVAAIIGWQGRLLDVEGRQRLDAVLQMGGDAATLILIGFLWVLAVPEKFAVAAICTVGMCHGISWLAIVYRVTGLGLMNAFRAFIFLPAAALATALVAALADRELGPTTGAAASFAVSALAVCAVVVLTVRRLHRQTSETFP